jgi:adenylate kinase
MLTANENTNSSRGRVILIMGAPGSGKGTQSSRLSTQTGIPCLSMGNILRSEANRNTSEGFRLRRLLASGSLVGDRMVCGLVESRLRREFPEKGAILDGFPRTVQQAEFLDGLLADLGLETPLAIHLDVSSAGMVRRLTARRQCAVCGAVFNLISRPSLRGSRCENDGGALVQRDDDTEGTIVHRLAAFEATSAPLIAFYRQREYLRIDGDRDPDLVAEDLLTIVAGRPPRRRESGLRQAVREHAAA